MKHKCPKCKKEINYLLTCEEEAEQKVYDWDSKEITHIEEVEE